ncbi:serine/arginine repetitive matrix protein 3 isoform X1 [Neopsephotus bourkii]|uniref:serine/arginine repetitive matrix protein 3 isoform X1 n=1 Tax=Neopsephotus bourkii TaxID=309878 RepID=UPI002AA540C9|nr:serine/arginine repetitive matrix protein 3 isoform X1 [Neopsephotus bourkii]
MALYNNGAEVPSPQEASNGFPQPGASGTWHKGEEEARLAEPTLVKKAHREILDHERKRRVELKCMELQEMMEEQGYSEEEIRQKVGTFRQMLMEKEGVLTREDQHGRQIVIENHHGVDGEEYAVEYPDSGEGCLLQCDCSAECYREDSGHREYRLKRRSSSSTSPPPKKKKKKKSGHRRSRKKRKPGSERSCDSSSPIRKEKKKKTGKKHRRDRSESGSRKKRRHRSRSPKSKRKERNKERKRSRSESPAWRSHRRSSCSSHSASLSSDGSSSKSPGRLSPKRRQDGPKGSSARSSRSRSSPSPQRSASPHQNGHKGSAQNGRHSHGAPLPEPSDRPASASPSPRAHGRTDPASPRTRGGRHAARSPRSPSPERGKHGHRHRSRSASSPPPPRHRGQSKGRPPAPREPAGAALSPAGYSSDSEGSAGSGSHPYHPPLGADRNHGAKKVKNRHHRGRPNSSSESSAKHSRHASERRKSPSPSPGQRSTSWSSSGSLSKSRSRSRDKRAGRSRSRSPSPKKTASREKDNEPRTRHGDPDPTRARRRSRSYSPIRKRRRDSPSFMEPRRITRSLLESIAASLAPRRSQASHPLLPPQPLVLQLAEHLLLQPQPQPQLRQLQQQPQPQPDSQPPQPLPQPQPQPQLQQPQQLRERRLLSPLRDPDTEPRWGPAPPGEVEKSCGGAEDGPGGEGERGLEAQWVLGGDIPHPLLPDGVCWGSGWGRGGIESLLVTVSTGMG